MTLEDNDDDSQGRFLKTMMTTLEDDSQERLSRTTTTILEDDS